MEVNSSFDCRQVSTSMWLICDEVPEEQSCREVVGTSRILLAIENLTSEVVFAEIARFDPLEGVV